MTREPIHQQYKTRRVHPGHPPRYSSRQPLLNIVDLMLGTEFDQIKRQTHDEDRLTAPAVPASQSQFKSPPPADFTSTFLPTFGSRTRVTEPTPLNEVAFPSSPPPVGNVSDGSSSSSAEVISPQSSPVVGNISPPSSSVEVIPPPSSFVEVIPSQSPSVISSSESDSTITDVDVHPIPDPSPSVTPDNTNVMDIDSNSQQEKSKKRAHARSPPSHDINNDKKLCVNVNSSELESICPLVAKHESSIDPQVFVDLLIELKNSKNKLEIIKDRYDMDPHFVTQILGKISNEQSISIKIKNRLKNLRKTLLNLIMSGSQASLSSLTDSESMDSSQN
ncbi:hypothetical protein M8J76_016316 [Diaphorina citri]|nr:hypothetical protein M8J75_001331 [Diaphorina citri]KAI5733817.1 hypothetical protein M8J76_016316 [Diaphorina citri]